VETAEAWQTALEAKTTPSILALSRQGLAQFRHGDMAENKTAKGAYVAVDCDGTRQITLLASGSEVGIAIDAQKQLADSGINAAVVSVPCLDLFAMQDAAYRSQVLGKTPRIAIEAGLRQSWDWLLDETDSFIGMTGFGASAPIDDLYNHFGITADAVVAAAKRQIG
jgi:transketolase